jgi:hypothetical protein
MKIDVEFSENAQTFSAGSKESGHTFSGDFGELQTIHDGQNGATFVPSVSADGTLSWENDRELPNPEPVNIMGPKGDAGAPGPAYTLTATDKAEIVSAVIAALPVYNGEAVSV